jgi:ribosomal-protein-alanine N-acetyltransferase
MLDIIKKQLPIKVSNKYFVRYISHDDKEDLFQLYGNEKVAKYAARKTHCSIKDTEAFIQLIIKQMKENCSVYLGICEVTSQKLIGIIRFFKKEDPRTLTIGYALNEDYWGQGILNIALSSLIHLIKIDGTYIGIRATIKPNNISSQRFIEKLGFKLHSRFIKSEIINNKEVETERLLYYKII